MWEIEWDTSKKTENKFERHKMRFERKWKVNKFSKVKY